MLDIDHDHKTGEIRGLLDHRCNRALGYLKNPHHLTMAGRYLAGPYTGYFVPKKKRRAR